MDGSGRAQPTVWAIAAGGIHNCYFETMRTTLEAPRTPSIRSTSLSRIADWDVREPEVSGSVLIRLAVLSEEQLGFPSCEAAQHSRPDDTQILLLVLRPTPRRAEFARALVDGIGTLGAFDPANNDYHPLGGSREWSAG